MVSRNSKPRNQAAGRTRAGTMSRQVWLASCSRAIKHAGQTGAGTMLKPVWVASSNRAVKHAGQAGTGSMSKQLYLATWFALILISPTSLFVQGLPIRGPDLDNCLPVRPFVKPVSEPLDCCFVDTSKPVKQFKFNSDLPMRVRRPAHKLDEESVRKYERAVELMKALPPEDPRSAESQAKIHCAYCTAGYNQFNTSMVLTVHTCWLFLPFHRWFLYFYERILASLIGDDTFAIPYWAWDMQYEHPAANSIPLIYTNKNSPLYDKNRAEIHQPPCRADLQYDGHTENRALDEQMQVNNYAMWQCMISQVRTPEAFYGGKFSQGDRVQSVHGGNFELHAHAAIHFWTGDGNYFGEDLGPSYSAARDPIFFAHHSQVDRLWLMWKSWGGKDFDDTDWLDAEYVFYDENADLVRVNIRDSLNFSNFRVTYEDLEPDWLNYTPKSIRETDPKYAHASIWRRFCQVVGGRNSVALLLKTILRKETNYGGTFPLGEGRRHTVTWRVYRPDALRSTGHSSDELLVIRGIVEKPFDATVFVEVFLELPEAEENTPQHCAEFLGSIRITNEGLGDGGEFGKMFSIRDSLQILGITYRKSVTVTFVPSWDPKYDPHVSVRVTDLTVQGRP